MTIRTVRTHFLAALLLAATTIVGCEKESRLVDSPCAAAETMECVGPTRYRRLRTVDCEELGYSGCNVECSGQACQPFGDEIECPTNQVCISRRPHRCGPPESLLDGGRSDDFGEAGLLDSAD